jgi:hypothetical protein
MTLKRVMRYASLALLFAALMPNSAVVRASSHREAPLISNDPLADNTDLYAFRSPDDTNTITIIANYIPFELPEGGPNYFSFGENIRYEIHIKNNAATKGDDITYRFTFTKTNEDPTTFFNIRLGKENLKTTYICERSMAGGAFQQIATGWVPAPNIGPRSIESVYGLKQKGDAVKSAYRHYMDSSIVSNPGHETIYAGPVDDPFFVDLAGIFDLGGFRAKGKDGVAGFNCHTIALRIPISMLQKEGHGVSQATSILDPNFVIGVWASASRPQITTLSLTGGKPSYSGEFVQVSRLGMPLTNEAIIPIGMKDAWNATKPDNDTHADLTYAANFTNPELALYVGNGLYSAAVPGLAALKIDTNSLGGGVPGKGFDFRNGADGLYPVHGSAGTVGTAFDANTYGPILLQKANPRSVDILPIFYTGVPNLIPYQLATGKAGNPLAAGKPFINNFLPTLGDMLRLNMAVPVTPRTSPQFSSEGLIWAAVLGLTDTNYNKTTALQFIPNMDGFPNGRRLEDDVTTIEMQAVGGLVLNAIGVGTDDPTTAELFGKVGFNAGVTHNDTTFVSYFPFMAEPWRGTDGLQRRGAQSVQSKDPIGLAAPGGFFLGQNFPNPVSANTTIRFHSSVAGSVAVKMYDIEGREMATLVDTRKSAGDYSVNWSGAGLANGTYIAVLYLDGARTSSLKITVSH